MLEWKQVPRSQFGSSHWVAKTDQCEFSIWRTARRLIADKPVCFRLIPAYLRFSTLKEAKEAAEAWNGPVKPRRGDNARI